MTRTRVRRLAQAAWDALAWIVAVPLAMGLRYDFSPPAGQMLIALFVGLFCAALQLCLGFAVHLYRGRYMVGSFDEVLGVTVIAMTVGVIGTLGSFLFQPDQYPRSTLVIATGLAAAAMLAGRYFWRALRQQTALGRPGNRTLIYGAGDSGSQLVSLMLADAGGEFQPVGFLEDNPAKSHLRLRGIRILGRIDDLEEVVASREVQTLVVAIAGISAAGLLELDRRCQDLGIKMRIIPTASEIVGGAVKLGDIADVTEEDLLGRTPVQTDEDSIGAMIRGKRVLVTGAGGSIGSELARQLTRYAPSRLTLLDRDESVLHSLQLTLDGRALMSEGDLVLADIRDLEKLRKVFAEVRPEVVFHAAALKHLPMLERYPDEALKTNVYGTQNVLAAAEENLVDVFVNISTDKAADPISVLGWSKLATERLTAGIGLRANGRYISVRFGNVLGSRGSVLNTFRFQIERGGPVTVTDARVRRYFMTVREAVHLVLQAAAIGDSGETLILDMGEPVSIAQVAQYMIDRSGRQISIEYTGLRPGEKLDEILMSLGEATIDPRHPLISHARVRPLDVHSIDPELADADPRRAIQTIAEMS